MTRLAWWLMHDFNRAADAGAVSAYNLIALRVVRLLDRFHP